MSHDDPHGARRAASHGSLSSSYHGQDHDGASYASNSQPHFKPLRSIREHTFLDPAASADGMLRKTTETGNIGLFSIHANNTKTLRHRASLGDMHRPMQPLARSRGPARHDDGQKLPSHRDSTSEIISMYGSDNQCSSSNARSGTLSPAWDETGQRSYSMTTCGSKGNTMPRNHGAQQPQDFNPQGQRPRSPYPYPTRLPRPGIRPSSPALAENGLVDYSRMVEIDRVPQRTTHHPHKLLFPNKTTRDPPLPLSVRYDVNQSTHSLSDQPRRVAPVYRSKVGRQPLPDSQHPWGLRPRERLGSPSSCQSLETSSMASALGGYGSATSQTSKTAPARKSPIFYDYSEDFEDVVIEPPQDYPISPTSRDTFSAPSPDITGEIGDTSCSVKEQDGQPMLEFTWRATPIGDLSDDEQLRPVSQLHQRDIANDPRAHAAPCDALTVDTVSTEPEAIPDASYYSYQDCHSQGNAATEAHIAQEERAVQANATSLMSEVSTIDSPLEPVTPSMENETMVSPPENRRGCSAGPKENCNTIPDGSASTTIEEQIDVPESLVDSNSEPGNSVMSPQQHGVDLKDTRSVSLHSGMTDLASFIKYVDRHIQSPRMDRVDEPEMAPSSTPTAAPVQAQDSHHNEQQFVAPPRQSSLRNPIAAEGKLNSKIPSTVDELEQYQVVSTRSGPTLVPQPISPAKMLRLKNSIPRLMKALPPLPEYDANPDYPSLGPSAAAMGLEPIELSQLTDARSTLIETTEPDDQDEAPKGFDPFVFDRKVQKPKLKLRYAASFAQRAQERSHTSSSEQPESDVLGRSDAPIRRRLPLRMSRSATLSPTDEDNDTVKRRLGVPRSSTVSELISTPAVDLFSNPISLPSSMQDGVCFSPRRPAYYVREQVSVPSLKCTSTARLHEDCPDDGARGASLDTQLGNFQKPISKAKKAPEGEMHSFFSDTSGSRPRQGLKKRLSNIKSRLTEAIPHTHTRCDSDRCDGENSKKRPLLESEDCALPSGKDLQHASSQQTIYHKVASKRKVRSRLQKLMKHAKHKIRAWSKVKLRT